MGTGGNDNVFLFFVKQQPEKGRNPRKARRTYSRSPKNPALQLLQKSSKSASTTPQRPIWNTFGTIAVRDFWENDCTAILPKNPPCNSSKSVPNRPLWGRRGRFGSLLQQLECGIFERTAVQTRKTSHDSNVCRHLGVGPPSSLCSKPGAACNTKPPRRVPTRAGGSCAPQLLGGGTPAGVAAPQRGCRHPKAPPRRRAARAGGSLAAAAAPADGAGPTPAPRAPRPPTEAAATAIGATAAGGTPPDAGGRGGAGGTRPR